MQSELKLVHTIVQSIDAFAPWAQKKVSSVLQSLKRDGESQLPPPNDILFIPCCRKVSVGIDQGQWSKFPPPPPSVKESFCNQYCSLICL